jgi:hypothetical protein
MQIGPEDHHHQQSDEPGDRETASVVNESERDRITQHACVLRPHDPELLIFQPEDPDASGGGEHPGVTDAPAEPQKTTGEPGNRQPKQELEGDGAAGVLNAVAAPLCEPAGGDVTIFDGMCEEGLSLRKLAMLIVIAPECEMSPQIAVCQRTFGETNEHDKQRKTRQQPPEGG